MFPRPAELGSRLTTGDLDCRSVVTKADDQWNYRIETVSRSITEVEFSTLVMEVVSSHEAFRAVVFGSQIDVELAPAALADDVRSTFEHPLTAGSTRADASVGLVRRAARRLGLGGVETAPSGTHI